MPTRIAILTADGNPGTIPALPTSLGDQGCEIIAVSDASYVLSMAMRHKPAAVLLGARLPAGGSLTALRRLRASVHCASIPVLAFAEPGAQKQALLSAGAEECFEPPVSEAEVVAGLQRCLGMSRTVGEAPAETLRDPGRLSESRRRGCSIPSPTKRSTWSRGSPPPCSACP